MFSKYNAEQQYNKLIKYVLKKPEVFNVDLKTAIISGFSRENIDILLKKGINININCLSIIITSCDNYEQLKRVKAFKYAHDFFIKDKLSQYENHLYSLLHDNHYKNNPLKENVIVDILKQEKGKEIKEIINKYDIDITLKTKNNHGNFILNACYFIINNLSIQDFNEKITIPRNVSFDYLSFIKEYMKIDEDYKIYRGISYSIILQIKNNKYQFNEEEFSKTEKGNTMIHIQAAFNRNENIKMNETFNDECINNNGWTPLFTSTFYGNSTAKMLAFDMDQTDYFGNSAQFYELKSSKQ